MTKDIVVEVTFASTFDIARMNVYRLDGVKEHVYYWDLPSLQRGVRCAFLLHPDEVRLFVEQLRQLPMIENIEHVHIAKKESSGFSWQRNPLI